MRNVVRREAHPEPVPAAGAGDAPDGTAVHRAARGRACEHGDRSTSYAVTAHPTMEDLMRPPVPPFTAATAAQKVQAAEDAWNTRDPAKVAAAYTPDTLWRNRSEFLTGRAEVEEFLRRKWERELDYALRKSLWAFGDDRIAVRFQYEWHDGSGQWWRSYGNENWEFDADGYMRRREASINDVRIDEADRRIFGTRSERERDDEVPLGL